MTTAPRRRPVGTAALAAALVLVAGACRAEARSQANGAHATEPQEPACVTRDGTDFSTRVQQIIQINILAIPAHGKTTCTNGDWHYEALGIASTFDPGQAGDNFRRSFELAQWERIADDGVQLIYRGPCSERMACEATVTITATSPSDSVIDAVMTGRVVEP